MYGGSSFATSHLPTAHFPAYRGIGANWPVHAASAPPTAAWIAPDLVHARAAGSTNPERGARGSMSGAAPTRGFISPRGCRHTSLQCCVSLGYRVHLHVGPRLPAFREPSAAGQFSNSRSTGDWARRLSRSVVLRYRSSLPGGRGAQSNGYFCDRRLDRRDGRGIAASKARPPRGGDVRVGHRSIANLTNRAPWVPTVYRSEKSDVVSGRLRNYEYKPGLGLPSSTKSWIS